MIKPLKIGNTQAFWGDLTEASATLVRQQPDLDFLTLDYLSEVSLSIMAAQRAKDPSAGYARDFIEVIKSLIPYWKAGHQVKVITNAGGLDPKRCALACREVLCEAGLSQKILGVVFGDDVLEKIKADPGNPTFKNLETDESMEKILDRLTTANAYLGSRSIAEVLKQGADIVITGRIADPSLTVGPCVTHFNWAWDDYDRLAQASVAGHLIECGTQVTGGISTRWLEIENAADLGFPVVEVNADGTFVITKPNGTAGMVTIETVKEQLLYEIGDPGAYLSPDVTVSFLSLVLKEVGPDRIAVSGALGRTPPEKYKVSATYRDGFKVEGMLAFFGPEAALKARRCSEIVLERVRKAGYVLERSCIECIGAGDIVPGILPPSDVQECMLRIAVADHRMEALECFARQMAPLVTSGPQGTTGYTSGRPHIRPVFGYWPCCIERSVINPQFEIVR